MDALSRLAPVAMPLLLDIDASLVTLGAPPTHPVWRLLGAVGATPAQFVEFVAELEPDRLRAAADALREHERTYGHCTIPPEGAWEGAAARDYATTAAALRDHLADAGELSLAGRLAATASYVDSVAQWQQRLRDDVARALARVMLSSEAVTLRAHRAQSDPAALTAAVHAAAEVAAVLLGVAAEAAQAGQDVVRASSGLDELAYHRPAYRSPTYEGRINLH